MKHQPECFYDGERDDTEWRDAEDSPCICGQLTTAYQRGREDAANGINDAKGCWVVEHTTGWDLFCREHAIAAALGESAE